MSTECLLSAENMERLYKESPDARMAERSVAETLRASYVDQNEANRANAHTQEMFNRVFAEESSDKFFDEAQHSKESLHIDRANGMLIGLPSAGKSTLILSVFGDKFDKGAGPRVADGTSTTSSIQPYSFLGKVPFTLYDSMGIESSSALTTRQSSGQVRHTIGDIESFLEQKAKSKNPSEHIHFVWYCIPSNETRFQECEEELITKMVRSGLPVIIVLTKCQTVKTMPGTIGEVVEGFANQFQGPLKERIFTVRVCAQDILQHGEVVAKAFGLKTLVDVTCRVLPMGQKMAMTRALIPKRSRKLCAVTAYVVIGVASLAAGAAMLICPTSKKPKVLAKIQVVLLSGICFIFGVAKRKDFAKVIKEQILKTNELTASLTKKAEGVKDFGSDTSGKLFSSGWAMIQTAKLGKATCDIITRMRDNDEEITPNILAKRLMEVLSEPPTPKP